MSSAISMGLSHDIGKEEKGKEDLPTRKPVKPSDFPARDLLNITKCLLQLPV
jgi:hypothetical protein